MDMEVKDEKTAILAVPATEEDTEQLGKFLVNAGQDGYHLKMASLVQEDKGTQRDPWVETKGVKLTVSK